MISQTPTDFANRLWERIMGHRSAGVGYPGLPADQESLRDVVDALFQATLCVEEGRAVQLRLLFYDERAPKAARHEGVSSCLPPDSLLPTATIRLTHRSC